MNLFDTGDFRIKNWFPSEPNDEIMLGVGYEYTFLAGGNLNAAQIAVPNGVPDGGQSGMLLVVAGIALGIVRKVIKSSSEMSQANPRAINRQV
jgi:hypothetical protein